MFRGFQVIEAHEFNGIIIHVGRIPGALPTVAASATYVQQNPVMVPNENVQVQPIANVAREYLTPNLLSVFIYTRRTCWRFSSLFLEPAPVQSQGTIAVPPTAPRTVSIKVPDDFVPGTKIRIQNPEGRIVNVSQTASANWMVVSNLKCCLFDIHRFLFLLE